MFNKLYNCFICFHRFIWENNITSIVSENNDS